MNQDLEILKQEIEILFDALVKIKSITDDCCPNSGWGYLGDINEIREIAVRALRIIEIQKQ